MNYLILTRAPLYPKKPDSKFIYHTYTVEAESKNEAMIKLEDSVQLFDEHEKIIGVSEIYNNGVLHYHLSASEHSATIHPDRGEKPIK
jgi:hypothetical protein